VFTVDTAEAVELPPPPTMLLVDLSLIRICYCYYY